MKASEKIALAQASRDSRLCVGIDPNYDKMPEGLTASPADFERFVREIIAATAEYACAFKFNLAFFERLGGEGLHILGRCLADVPTDLLTIADAKRGDIGNTATAYAQTYFETFGFDSITINPYMGRDAIDPFLNYPGKLAFVLAHTSNPGAADFQYWNQNGEALYREVLRRSSEWASEQVGECGFVVGATKAEIISEVRGLSADAPLLIPGVGAQGGDPAAVIEANGTGPCLVNVSRGVMYASSAGDYSTASAKAAKNYRDGLR